MPVGIITQSVEALPSVWIESTTQNVDLAALLGNPTSKILYSLIVPSAVLIGSSSVSTVSLDATGLTEDSVGIWTVLGNIYGAGGDGGNGWGHSSGNFGDGGGGGGGGGNIVGLGGSGAFTAGDGADGVDDLGGNGGQSFATASGDIVGSLGIAGGDSVTLNHPVTMYVSGVIGGGGGGGDGANSFDGDFDDGGDGGGLGTAGGNGSSPGATQGGAAGFAIRYSGSGNATINIVGSGFVLGTVG